VKVIYFNRKILYWVVVGIVVAVLIVLLLSGGKGTPPQDNYPTIGEAFCRILKG